ncbi:RAVE subunit 2/Rogdi [Astrocystis sublimbata]|nr:RAVE subunit 2/Rogdi [Astrocystis sublimbata]
MYIEDEEEDDFVLVGTYTQLLSPLTSPNIPQPPKQPLTQNHPQPHSHSQTTQARELTWLVNSLQATLRSLRNGLEECYALLDPPIDPGSTLVLSTPRAELVKGHVTRVGARIIKGTIHTKLRTTAPLTITINPTLPIHLAPLVTLNSLLTQAVDLARLCLAEVERRGQNEGQGRSQADDLTTATFLSSQLRLLAQGIDEASAILKGSPTNITEFKPAQSPSAGNASRPGTATSTAVTEASIVATSSGVTNSDWTQYSAASTSFSPPLSQVLSFHITIQDACIVLHLRALEPADAPVNLGIKLALAIGTARRLEHDEADKVFTYTHHESDPSAPPAETSHAQGQEHQAYPTSGTRALASAGKSGSQPGSQPAFPHSGGGGGPGGEGRGGGNREVGKVYVREKVRVESADPCLLSISTKLSALSNSLNLARRNLAAVMGDEFTD